MNKPHLLRKADSPSPEPLRNPEHVLIASAVTVAVSWNAVILNGACVEVTGVTGRQKT